MVKAWTQFVYNIIQLIKKCFQIFFLSGRPSSYLVLEWDGEGETRENQGSV
jgi:hypothetical protein